MNPTGDAMYDGQPDNDQVMQDETTLPAVPVRIEGNTRVQILPARDGAYRTVSVDSTGARVLTADPRRQAAYLVSLDDDMLVGASQAEALAGGVWPANTPMPVGHAGEVWTCPATSGGTTRITVVIEQWAL